MGNEHGSLSGGRDPVTGKRLPSLRHFLEEGGSIKHFESGVSLGSKGADGSGGGGDGGGEASPGGTSLPAPGLHASEHLKTKGEVTYGDKFVTWVPTRQHESSYLEGKVVGVFHRAPVEPMYQSEAVLGKTEKDPLERRKLKTVVLEFRTEMDLDSLKASVERAQQAMNVEKEWVQKLAGLGLSPGASAELWVPTLPSSNRPARQRLQSQLKTRLDTPRRRRRLSAAKVSAKLKGEVADESVVTPRGSALKTVSEDRVAVSGDTDDDDGARTPYGGARTPSLRWSNDVSPPPDPDNLAAGDLFTFTLVKVDIRWHYTDATIVLKLVRRHRNADGEEADGPEEEMAYGEVRQKLEEGKAARETLNQALAERKERDGITIGSKVDLWVDELDATVRALVTDIGHEFKSLTEVELKPTVKFFMNGTRRNKSFDDYVTFVAAWKMAKYMAEQEARLTQEAYEKGITVGQTVSIWQFPGSRLWSFKEGGALDAEVKDMRFKFHPARNDVSMTVQVNYVQRSGPDPKRARRVPLVDEPELQEEWLEFDELCERLRCKVIVAYVSCNALAEMGKPDPYIKLSLGGTKQKTTTKSNELNPTWEDLEITFREGEDFNKSLQSKASQSYFDQVMELRALDYAGPGHRGFLGVVPLNLEDLVPTGKLDTTLRLGAEPGKPAKKNEVFGKIRIVVNAIGPRITHNSTNVTRNTANMEFVRKRGKSDGMDLFIEAYGK